MMFVSDILGERGDVLFSLNRPRGQSDFDPMARRVLTSAMYMHVVRMQIFLCRQ